MLIVLVASEMFPEFLKCVGLDEVVLVQREMLQALKNLRTWIEGGSRESQERIKGVSQEG